MTVVFHLACAVYSGSSVVANGLFMAVAGNVSGVNSCVERER